MELFSTRTSLPTETVSWSYDDTVATNYGKGRVASVTDPSGTTTYAYERRGLIRGERQTILSMPYLMTFGYDANGNRTHLGYPSGLSVDYAYDFADRQASARSPFVTYVGSVVRATLGPLTEVRYGNGTARTMTYDQRYRLLSNELLIGPASLASYGYQYDAVGNVTQIADALTEEAECRMMTANQPRQFHRCGELDVHHAREAEHDDERVDRHHPAVGIGKAAAIGPVGLRLFAWRRFKAHGAPFRCAFFTKRGYVASHRTERPGVTHRPDLLDEANG
ncbi:MAG: hypothetical protein ABI718_08735 [Acidobacteriota bacterium]